MEVHLSAPDGRKLPGLPILRGGAVLSFLAKIAQGAPLPGTMERRDRTSVAGPLQLARFTGRTSGSSPGREPPQAEGTSHASTFHASGCAGRRRPGGGLLPYPRRLRLRLRRSLRHPGTLGRLFPRPRWCRSLPRPRNHPRTESHAEDRGAEDRRSQDRSPSETAGRRSEVLSRSSGKPSGGWAPPACRRTNTEDLGRKKRDGPGGPSPGAARQRVRTQSRMRCCSIRNWSARFSARLVRSCGSSAS